MTEKQQKKAAAEFAEKWAGRGYEKGESQKFWLQLLGEVLGVEHAPDFIEFEDQVMLDNTSFIDGYIPSTRVMIEQKSLDKDLRKPIRQSDGTLLTPFQQAKRYVVGLPYSRHPRWVVVSNFREFLIYDMEQPNSEPESVLLADLEREHYRLHFLVDVKSEHLSREMEVSMQAGEIIGEIYDELLRQYGDSDPLTLRQLNILCVRLVFCLYAEDAGIFSRDQFHDYLAKHEPEMMRIALLQLFEVLNTPVEARSRFLRDDLQAFPYTNGGLFAEPVDIPQFTPELSRLLLRRASLDFDWSEISPTIFGAVFESTLNPETRRSGGMHYTSIENIHRVIDPLFLNDLKREFANIQEERVERTRQRRLADFQDRLASLTFFDPACGSGNFLTETYLSLRRLENEVVEAMTYGQTVLGFEEASPIKVNINQFYGIEINDFAVTVATTALWISEAQMLAETERIIHHDIDFLPLKTYANIHEGNALRIPWETVVPRDRLNYIIGNPPFVGARMMAQGSEQKKEVQDIFGKIKDVQDLDYVCCWYKKAAQLIQGTRIKVAFVSTNSICQGAQVPILWNILLNEYHVIINFAYQTFKWNSEANDKAAVHCVIIGFSVIPPHEKIIFSANGQINYVRNISPYLFEGDSVFAVSRKEPLCNVPKMNFGNQPRDGGYFILSEEERNQLLFLEPNLEKWIRPYIGAEEFIKRKSRYCLWLRNAQPSDIKSSKILYNRVKEVREFRLSSSAKTTQGYAKVPHLFAQITQPDALTYLLVPRVSSERRRYVPMGYIHSDVITNDAVQIIPDASLYHFGVLESNVHMAWMRAVCGRLESRYRYSKDIVYNNFPWPEVSDEQRERIAATAQAILDARALYPDSSLADLYDEITMPPELRRAHQANDRAVMAAYGFAPTMTESECVARLFALHQSLSQAPGDKKT